MSISFFTAISSRATASLMIFPIFLLTFPRAIDGFPTPLALQELLARSDSLLRVACETPLIAN